MSQTPEEKSEQSPVLRAEELMDNLGRRIGFFVASAGQRIQSTATSLREEALQADHQNGASGGKADQREQAFAGAKGQQAMERSEEQVDLMLQRLGNFAALAGYQIQRAAARAREEAEDIWAEAQNIRQENHRKLP